MNRLYNFYEGDTPSRLKRAYVLFDIVAILISLIPLMFFLEEDIVSAIEYSTVSYFILDYLLRLIISKKKYNKGLLSYVIFVFSFYAIVDILAIIPVFFMVSQSLKSLRLLRLIRLIKTMRFFKMMKYSNSIDLIVRVFKKEAGLLLTVLTLALVFVFISALMIFQLEHDYQPEAFSTFFDAIWWAFATLTTVGYGDIYPLSTGGRLIAIIISFLGIAIVALPSGIIAAGFIEEFKEKKDSI